MKHFVQKPKIDQSINQSRGEHPILFNAQNSCSDCNAADYTGAKPPRTQPNSGERRDEITRGKHCPAVLTSEARGCLAGVKARGGDIYKADLKLVTLHWTVLKHQSCDPPIRASLLCYGQWDRSMSSRVICTCLLLCFRLFLFNIWFQLPRRSYLVAKSGLYIGFCGNVMND